MHRNRNSERMLILNHHVVASLDAIQMKPSPDQRSNGVLASQRGVGRHLPKADQPFDGSELAGGKPDLFSIAFHRTDIASYHLGGLVQRF